jgi:protein-disulfide isomerase
MKKLVLLSLVLAACQSDTKNLERKIDDLNKKIDNLVARGGAGAAQQRPAPRPEPDRAKTYAVPIDGDPSEGAADAKITIVKAYDYACPYCEKVRGTMEDLKKKYGNDLRIVYKQLVVHPKQATVGALAFCAAGKQGKAMEMDRMLWDKGFNARQFDLTEVPSGPAAAEKPAPGQGPAPAQPQPGQQMVKCWDHPDGCKNVYGWATELGLNLDRFKADMKGDCQQLIQKDGRELAQLGVNATPGFFINGRFISGAQPIEQFTQVIDEELKKANEKIGAGTPAASYYQQWVLDKGLKSLSQ